MNQGKTIFMSEYLTIKFIADFYFQCFLLLFTPFNLFWGYLIYAEQKEVTRGYPSTLSNINKQPLF